MVRLRVDLPGRQTVDRTDDLASPKVILIEPRVAVAYGLILILVAAITGLALYIRHNSHAVRTERESVRDRRRRESRLLEP